MPLLTWPRTVGGLTYFWSLRFLPYCQDGGPIRLGDASETYNASHSCQAAALRSPACTRLAGCANQFTKPRRFRLKVRFAVLNSVMAGAKLARNELGRPGTLRCSSHWRGAPHLYSVSPPIGRMGGRGVLTLQGGGTG